MTTDTLAAIAISIVNVNIETEIVHLLAEFTLILVLFTDASHINLKLLFKEHNLVFSKRLPVTEALLINFKINPFSHRYRIFNRLTIGRGYFSMKRLMFGGATILLLSASIISVNAQTLKQTSITQPSQLITQNTPSLMAVADDGTPQGITKEQWLKANGTVSVSSVSNGNYQVTVNATGLVPNGLYTFWWVNKKLVGMDMGPAGGVENNSFRADANGNATKTITVPANNNYQMLVAAYHADNQTHGEMPGEMGKVTFGHLAGDFPQVQ